MPQQPHEPEKHPQGQEEMLPPPIDGCVASDGEDDEVTTGTCELDVEAELSSTTLAFLKQHLAEKEEQARRLDYVPEQFALAQFWYSNTTAQGILLEALAHVTGAAGDESESDDGVVAILSAPSVMGPAKELEGGKHLAKLKILEIDERFGVQWPDNFHHYDYNEPEVLPSSVVGKATVCVIDPPRLNIATLQQYFVSCRLLAKPSKDGRDPPCIVVTAALLEDAVREEFGLRPVAGFEVQHTTKLGNPLQLYTNYPPKLLDASSWGASHDN